MLMTRRGMTFGLLTLSSLPVVALNPIARAVAATRPLLSINGAISRTQGESADFDRETLEALGTKAFETTCPWYTGAVKFEGPLMRDVLARVGADGKTLVVQALNDYVTEIPMDDFKRYDVVLALKRDGEYMSVRDKGPLFIVYPYDSDPELKSQQYYKRSAWQVARMTVK
jgi:hypothetical protein